jgi:diketogulonate reductase-like aldo/keto reductase
MSPQLTLASTLPLPNLSITIPRLGFGVYRSTDTQCITSCLNALKAGYRHIDTAQFYANEAEVGVAIRRSGLQRSDVFVTTKILGAGGSVEKSYEKCVASVEKIDPGEGGYVDLFLIHSPNSGSAKRKEMWLALERLYEEGKAKSIGVSNFGVGHIEEMKGYAKVWPPHVNQIELHPWCQQRVIDEYCQKHGIVVEAYSPLVRNTKSHNETLVEMSKRYGVTTAQILIRYSLQKNWVPLPKSDTPSRIIANAHVYGFEISKEDMSTLDELDQGDAGAIVQSVTNS